MTGAGFSSRWNGTELMDDPACDEARLLRTVDQFASINFLVSRYRTILRRWVLADMRHRKGPFHLADIGAGGCEIAVWLLREAGRLGIDLRVTAIDADPRIASHARRRCRRVPGLVILDGTHERLRELEQVDYVFTNHVMHHLTEHQLAGFLRLIDASVTRRWIMNDLARSRLSYAGFQVLGRFYRGSFAFEDGCRSIRRAFTREELAAVIAQSGLGDHVRIHRLLPGRLVAVGTRPL